MPYIMSAMDAQNKQHTAHKPTRLFVKYATSLAVRTTLLVMGAYFFVVDRAQLALANVGLAGGMNFVDVAFVFVLLDFLSKFSSRANISIGSLKQYKFFQIPTKNTVGGSIEALLDRVSEIVSLGAIRKEKRHMHPKKDIQERLTKAKESLVQSKDETFKELRHIARDVDFMRALPFDDSDLDVNSQARHVLRMRRLKEVLPVAIFWVVFTAVVGVVLIANGWMSSATAVLWMLLFFWFDMVCVVLWCPLQLLFMHNRCCATCQIFNWDAIMVATPLIFAWSIPSAILLALGVVVLLRWEIRAFFHPERFAEETNASLSCAHCTEQLCLLRGKVGDRQTDKELKEALR